MGCERSAKVIKDELLFCGWGKRFGCLCGLSQTKSSSKGETLQDHFDNNAYEQYYETIVLGLHIINDSG